jgi:hypothetical protein
MSWDGFRVSLRISRLLGIFPFDREFTLSRPWLLYSGGFVAFSLLDTCYVTRGLFLYLSGFEFLVIAFELMLFLCVVILFPVCGYIEHEGLVGVIREVDSIDLRLKLRKIRTGGKLLALTLVMFTLCVLLTGFDLFLHGYEGFHFCFVFTYNANWLILQCLVLQFTLFISGLERRLGIICRKLNSVTKTSELIELCTIYLLLNGVCDRVNRIYSLRLLYLTTATFIMVVAPSFFCFLILKSLPFGVVFVIVFVIFTTWASLSSFQLLQVVQVCSSTSKKAGQLGISLIIFDGTCKTLESLPLKSGIVRSSPAWSPTPYATTHC